MKKLFLAAVAVFVFGIAAQAQSTGDGKVDIYGGYTFQHTRSDGDGLNLNGFNIGTNIWLTQNKKLGINGEYSFTTGNNSGVFNVNGTFVSADIRTRYNSFAGGPIYRFSTGRVKPFVRGLVGATRVSTQSTFTNPLTSVRTRVGADATSFTFIGGGGVDVDLTKDGRIAFRVGAVDYQFIKDSNLFNNQNGIRLSTGIIIRF
jgi:opacity protein-like surface antigen